MRTLFDFHGGIHPAEQKALSNQTEITQVDMPEMLILPLQQHIGHPSVVIASVGDHVLKGQLLAEPRGPVSVGLHAPTSGTIEAIKDCPLPHPSAMTGPCIILKPDNNDQWCQLSECANYQSVTPTEILSKIRESGIAGMGGAGFPTEIKLHPPRRSKVATLILNGAECEPYITADDRLMRERASDIIQGMEIMAWLLAPGECLIVVEDNKPEAIAQLKKAAEQTNIEIVTIPTKYPAGGEKQLIQLVIGKEVPNGKIPADIGVMCQNVATAAALYQAIRYGKPLISRITTVTGEGVDRPGNYEVLLGTPISHLLTQAGFQESNTSRLIMGGPMMGFTIQQIEAPVIKTTNCILAADNKELPAPPPAQACIRCGLCSEVCPAELLPQQLYWFSRAQEFEKAEQHNLFDCIECGACSYVCPSAIPLVQYYRFAKGQIKENRAEQEKSNQARERFEFRQERLAKEAAEKEAKRKARAEAAAKAQALKKAKAAEEAGNAPAQTKAK